MRPALAAALLSVAALPTPCALPAWSDEVSVFAAASLKEALDQVAALFAAQTGHAVSLSYGGSNILARQIIEGAPADLFVSASGAWMDEVETAGQVRARRDLLGNRLVLIAHEAGVAPLRIDSGTDLAGLLAGGRLAMALVDSVPAGQYGKAALETLGLWDDVAADVAQSDNVRAALALVATGEAPYGIVYATDAAAQNDVTVVAEFPADSHPPITYPAALLAGASDEADRAFYDALAGDEARAIFRSHGFAVAD